MIDFHCHLDLYPEPHEVARKCQERDIFVLSVTTTPSAWRGTQLLGESRDNIHTALGLHPQLAAERRSELGLFETYLPETRFVGEIGLDGAPEHGDTWNKQVEVFEHILRICQSAGGKILSIHSRRAASAVLDRLEQFRGAGTAVLHWFSGTVRELNRAEKLGCWFSVGPAMLRSKNGSALAARLPRERVVTETDGPFAQWEGRSLLPWDVGFAVPLLADVWDLGAGETEELIRENLVGLLRQVG